jgi:hypothetical protein
MRLLVLFAEPKKYAPIWIREVLGNCLSIGLALFATFLKSLPGSRMDYCHRRAIDIEHHVGEI